MKNLLILCLLLCASCGAPSPAAKSAPTDQEAISVQLKTGLDDPASYQSVSFKLDDPWTKADSASLGALNAGALPVKYLKNDSMKSAGHRYIHAFRAKNKMGGLVLSEKTCVVYPGGHVVFMQF